MRLHSWSGRLRWCFFCYLRRSTTPPGGRAHRGIFSSVRRNRPGGLRPPLLSPSIESIYRSSLAFNFSLSSRALASVYFSLLYHPSGSVSCQDRPKNAFRGSPATILVDGCDRDMIICRVPSWRQGHDCTHSTGPSHTALDISPFPPLPHWESGHLQITDRRKA